MTAAPSVVPDHEPRHRPVAVRVTLEGRFRHRREEVLEVLDLALARAAGGSRTQVRKALDNLEMTGRVRRHRSKAGTRIELLKFK